jgi:hypothetical protein
MEDQLSNSRLLVSSASFLSHKSRAEGGAYDQQPQSRTRTCISTRQPLPELVGLALVHQLFVNNHNGGRKRIIFEPLSASLVLS